MRSRESKTRFAVLGMLSFSAKTGYEISRALENSTAFFWSESDGQLYPILKQLTNQNLIKQMVEEKPGKRAKKIYSITKEGQTALVNWLQQEPTTFNIRNEFLLQLFFGHNVRKSKNVDKIKEYQNSLKKQLKLFNAIEQQIREKNKNPTYLLLSLSYGQQSVKSEIAWCNSAINILKNCHA